MVLVLQCPPWQPRWMKTENLSNNYCLFPGQSQMLHSYSSERVEISPTHLSYSECCGLWHLKETNVLLLGTRTLWAYQVHLIWALLTACKALLWGRCTSEEPVFNSCPFYISGNQLQIPSSWHVSCRISSQNVCSLLTLSIKQSQGRILFILKAFATAEVMTAL